MIAGILFGFLPLAIWLYLLLVRRGFWLLRERDTAPVAEPARWPSVVAVVPARNEADVIQRSIGSLLAQDYPGDFRVVLVDDQSDDGTGELARALNHERLTVLPGARAAAGLDRQALGDESGRRSRRRGAPEFLWFTDADIAHAPDNLRRLVARAEEGGKRAGLADGAAVLPHRGRAFPDSGLRLLLRHAVSVRRGQRSATANWRRRPAAACWRGARRWKRRAASTPSATTSSTIARWAGR